MAFPNPESTAKFWQAKSSSCPENDVLAPEHPHRQQQCERRVKT
jgi:hypothetical protein